ncbi:protoheme IX farnesyltransferase [Peribacillus cavernae]|uniref:Protoheme IX farnesyltransferase n=1 Tax=Peribacillus cavernae TaxID=1674310 RepID=A0A433HPS7_9BACI|nr:heme o synthase [Peribacillus cavernae]MDQ0217210.1 protoheme IX farnesyltransferase [Peribacillus cavernae]RUQ30319.1 protoheme IX farnesyltransferase [Peribacillus cavernae]
MSNPRALTEPAITDSEATLHAAIPKTTAWKDFMALVKIGIVNSNLITTFTGLWLALHFSGEHFLTNLDTMFFVLAGSSLIVAGSCSLNNYIDRDIDHLMERTKTRPTVTGKMSPARVLALSLALIAIGTVLLAFTNITTAVIGLIGVFSYVVLYTLISKRRFVSNTIVGSISGAIPPLIGWAAVDPDLSVMAWMLFLIMFIWQPPHFYAIAMKRCEEYRAAGIPMLPVVKGFKTTKRSMTLWVACLLPIPLFLTQLGMPLVILATTLNVGWLILAISGYKMKKNELKWARFMFVYSLNYMTILYVAMVIVTLI